jgi:hypothetical protein
MTGSRPYQPFLLRLLHNANALFVIGAIVTGYWVYNTYDGRFGKLPLPAIPTIIGLHGTFGLCFFLVIPAFAIYSFHAGRRRLIQPDTFQQLSQLNKPIGQYSLHRIVNTVMLLAATLAVVSGRMMQEAWLPAGQLNHVWYLLHLFAWLMMVICLATHLLMSAKVGGVPLLTAMLDVRFRPEDSPALWATRSRDWIRRRSRS